MTRVSLPPGRETAEEEVTSLPYSASPNAGRFKPGQSGNPRGRPRKHLPAQSAIESALNEQVTITDQKGKRKVSAATVIAKRLVQKAMAGDPAAIKELRAASPDFLKRVPPTEGKSGEGFFAHLGRTMSDDALHEFRNALATWKEEQMKAGRKD